MGGTTAPIDDLPGFAVSVAEFILALQGCDASGGPMGAAHSFYRGTSPVWFHGDIAQGNLWKALIVLADADAARAVVNRRVIEEVLADALG